MRIPLPRRLALALLLTGCASTLPLPPPGHCAVRGPGVDRPEPGCVTFVADLKACEDAMARLSAVPIVGGGAWWQATQDCMSENGYEEKIDGWRMLAVKGEGRVLLVSRNDRDHTKRFGVLVAALKALKPETFTLDGEVATGAPAPGLRGDGGERPRVALCRRAHTQMAQGETTKVPRGRGGILQAVVVKPDPPSASDPSSRSPKRSGCDSESRRQVSSMMGRLPHM